MSLLTSLSLLILASILILILHRRRHRRLPRAKVPVSVNYHFTRHCNKTCGFCFHTATTSHIESPERAKQGLRLLRDAGMRKINFAGGEPFLYHKFLGDMIDYCKDVLGLESVSIVTNGSLVKEAFLRKHARNIDILAVSCDSFDEATNTAIGRGSGDQVAKLRDIAAWCREYGIGFKLNTVVNKLNHAENMRRQVDELRPFRWKCFQVLIVAGENDSEATLRDGRKFAITDEQFETFIERHKGQEALVAEPNRLMAKSYLILDEYMRFLDRDGKKPSGSILDVGVEEALESVFWDETAFLERGGLYDWKKTSCAEGLDW